MYRKHYLQGCTLTAFAFGLILGRCLESWILCCCGGMLLLIMGICWMSRRR